MALAKIKKGDNVVVLAGRDKGKKGEVLRVIPDEGRAVVRGVNVVRKHQKETQTQQAGIVAREATIDLSNIALEDPKDGKPTKVGIKLDADGKKIRIAKRSGSVIPEPNWSRAGK